MPSRGNREGHCIANTSTAVNGATAHARSASIDNRAPTLRLAHPTVIGPMTETVNSELRTTVSGVLQQLPLDLATTTSGSIAKTPLRVVPSLFGSAAPTVLPQESVGVIVHLKSAPKLSSSTDLLSYEVEDGILATPQMACGASSQESEIASPQLRTPLTTCNGDCPAETSAFLPRPFAGADGDADAATAKATEMSLSLPRALASSSTQPSKPLPLPVAPAPTAMKSSTPPLHQEDGGAVLGGAAAAGRSIGSRGCVLTITSPTTRDRRQYEFGEVLGPEVESSALCDRLTPAIMAQMAAGYSVCVLCYGPSDSGNTGAMDALALTVGEFIFRSLDADNDVVEMSYTQIYRDEAYNLLDSARAGKFGAKLSRPRMGSASGCSASGSSCLGSASEPKVFIRSSAEVLAKVKAASRLRVTKAHALSARSSDSFTLLSFHITHFLDGVPLTTVRFTLADLAAAEAPKESGATGKPASQSIAINKSMMELRQLLESGGNETGVLHFRKSVLTTYLAPHLDGRHLILLVSVSLEAGSYEESRSSLEFAANARRRKVAKVKSWADSRLVRTAARFCGPPGFLSRADSADSGSARESISSSSEPNGVVEVLWHRIGVLEEALKIAHQRIAVAAEQLPRTEAFTDVNNAVPATAVGADLALLAHADALQRESMYYRGLLQERDFRCLQSVLALTAAEFGGASSALSDALDKSSLSFGENGAGTGADQQESATPPGSARSSGGCSVQSRFDQVDADDVHAQLRWCVGQLRSIHSRGCSDNEGYCDVLDRLRDAALRAAEQYEDMNEQLLVASSLLSGFRARNHRLYCAILRSHERHLAVEMEREEWRAALQAATLRASTAETALEQLRLQLFQAYAEQSIREEMIHLYLDAKSIAANVDGTVSGDRETEQQVELEKVQAHQQVLCDKITELVDNVEQLTRAVAQKDVSLAALESLITPAQRALFHTLSNTAAAVADHSAASVGDSEGGLASATAAAIASGDDSSAADCFSLLQSRVSELSSLLTREQQQHQLTQCELLEAREDARRSRQEQRQAFFQQQEEARRVGQLMAENFELRQQNERHQLCLDEMYVGLHEKLQQLRRRHEEEVAELRTAAREAPSLQRGNGGTVREGQDGKNEDYDDATSSITAHAPGRRKTLQGVPLGEDCLREGNELGSTATALSTADAADSGEVRCRPAAPLQRSGQARPSPKKSNGRRRGEMRGIPASARHHAIKTDAPGVLSQRVEESPKAVRRSVSSSNPKQQLFAKYGEPANPSHATSPLVKSGPIASRPPAARRRSRASAAAGKK
ncbi:hypothetical protein LSCM4_07152 [Leishmania orientalis]|uniref:Kinesin motor domain-containing protein n=1 Tax=Leishmania orientalis TaxID=2249476 RepID=A0A836HC66_9TRYP|nr:hypothetical protein LSCM4_07152 [Leishmania orientalis]